MSTRTSTRFWSYIEHAVPSDSGWRATVTCESGPGPIRLGVAPTEAQAIAAARWFIDSSQGCGGSGTYTVSSTQ